MRTNRNISKVVVRNKTGNDKIFTRYSSKLRKLMKELGVSNRLLREEFAYFNRVADGSELDNDRIFTNLKMIGSGQRLDDLRSQQQYDLVCEDEIKERIDRILWRRSAVFNELIKIQHELSKRLASYP